MDKDRVKGTLDDAAGRIKRQVGEWTGDTNAQVEGAAQQIKGKAEKAVGQVKDAARDLNEKHETRAQQEREHQEEGQEEHQRDREYQNSRP
ncbi:MAG: CsbD family protein [Terracidiphilus sp.]